MNNNYVYNIFVWNRIENWTLFLLPNQYLSESVLQQKMRYNHNFKITSINIYDLN